MKSKFNETQKEILKKAEKQGHLTRDDFMMYYSSPITIKANIKRFILLGLLKETDDEDKFEYVKQK
jgi:hypothetical protein